MIKYSAMNDRQRKVYTSVYNGWYLGGKYRALLDGREKVFWADSLPILYNEVDRWYARHERSHGHAHLLVKCVNAL